MDEFNEMIVGIIPARGGSKGIKRKNLLNVNGKPLIYWTIMQMRRSVKIDAVYVTSDCNEILDVAASYDANTILRPPHLSSDTSTSESAWAHALGTIRERGIEPKLLVLAQATSPVRRTSDFDEAIEKFYKDGLDSLFSCNIFDDFNYWEKREGKFSSINYDYNKRLRRQNISKKYHENGSFYITKPQILTEYNNRLGGKIGVHDMPNYTMFQLDEISDLDVLNVLVREYCEK
jgi:CMP-N,N'-diacetyllegionaminic acid synthase